MPQLSWPDRRLIELLGVAHPIAQAPMKGTSTPALAAAVSNAGGIGSLGGAGLSPGEIRAALADMRRRTNRPFNINFLIHDAVAPDPGSAGGGAKHGGAGGLEPLPGGPGRQAEVKADDGRRIGEQRGEVGLAEAGGRRLDPGGRRPELLFGVKGGEPVAGAGDVGEARALEAAGVDAIVAQGAEAGGHRGAFADAVDEPGTGLIALPPQIVDAVTIPVIAAGGIADGRGIVAVLALGAAGVQLGTAFVPCPESAASPAHRAVIAGATDRSTRVTRAISGRPARTYRTRYVEAMAAAPGPLPAYPLMYALSEPLLASGDPDFAFLLYGQAAGLAPAEPAAALVDRLVDETARALAALCGQP